MARPTKEQALAALEALQTYHPVTIRPATLLSEQYLMRKFYMLCALVGSIVCFVFAVPGMHQVPVVCSGYACSGRCYTNGTYTDYPYEWSPGLIGGGSTLLVLMLAMVWFDRYMDRFYERESVVAQYDKMRLHHQVMCSVIEDYIGNTTV